LLITKAEPTLERFEHPNLGRLVQPRHYPRIEDTAKKRPWAADNDAFNNFNKENFTKMLNRLSGLERCLFVAAPDVVADMDGTLELFEVWQPQIKEAGLPVALVLQDGMLPNNIPLDKCDAVFIGGTTEWKLGIEAAAIVKKANDREMWTHMGRVNSDKRIRTARAIGCKSVDGTGYAKFTDTHLLNGLNMVRYMGKQGVIF